MIRTSTFTLFRPPTASTLPFCRACNIFLYWSRQFSKFAEKQCPAVGLNEFAAMLFSSACKNVFLVPEQSRLDQVRARQLTATKGFVRRAPLPWIARAINFFPTPDSPSIKTGLTDAAAFAAALRTGSIAGERLITSAMVSVPLCLRLSRCNSPASTLVASALRSETCKCSAFAGLTTKSEHRRAGLNPNYRSHHAWFV